MTSGTNIRPVHVFTMAFGSSIGVSWIVLAGDWVALAGPVGAACCFLVGGLVVALIAVVYAEMASRFPVGGGEVAYAYAAHGDGAAFMVAWFLLLAYLGIAAFEAVSAAWVIKELLPIGPGIPLYTVGSHAIAASDIALGVGGTLLVLALNARGLEASARVQVLLAWAVIGAGVMLLGLALAFGEPRRLSPGFVDTGDARALGSTLLMAATAPYFMAGFNSGAQILGDRDDRIPVPRLVVALVVAVIAVTVFYATVPIAVAMALSRTELAAARLPVAAAASALIGSPIGGTAVVAVGALGMFGVWNAVTVSILQVWKLLARADFVPWAWARENRNGVPVAGLAAIALCCGAGTLVGRPVLIPVIGVGTVAYFLAFATVAFGAIRLRRVAGPAASEPVFGSILRPVALALAVTVVLLAVLAPAFDKGRFILPFEWPTLLAWSVLGFIAWRWTAAIRNSLTPQERDVAIFGQAS